MGVCDYFYKTAKSPPRDANIPELGEDTEEENINADKKEGAD